MSAPNAVLDLIERFERNREAQMPVAYFQSFIKPLLDLAADGKVHSISEARQQLGDGPGTSTIANYQIMRVDSDYFVEE